MNAPATVRRRRPEQLDKGTYGQEIDRVDWTYYDTLTLDPAVSQYILFNSSAGKDLSLTNYNGNGTFPRAQKLRIKAFKVEYTSNSVKNTAAIDSLYQLFNRSTIQLTITNQPPSYQKTLMETMGIPLAFHATPTVAGNNELIESFGRFLGIDPINRAIVLAELTPFTVPINFYLPVPAALAGDQIRIGLAGMLRRYV